MWLWCRPAAVAPIGPLAQEPPYAVGAALKSKKRKKVHFNSKIFIILCLKNNFKFKDLFIKKKKKPWHSHVVQRLVNLTSIPEEEGSIPGLARWVKKPVLS